MGDKLSFFWHASSVFVAVAMVLVVLGLALLGWIHLLKSSGMPILEQVSLTIVAVLVFMGAL